MRAGRLDRRITLLRATTARDEFNEPVDTFADLATVSASFHPDRGLERREGEQVAASQTCRFQIRWSSQVADLNPKDQLVFDGKTYGITGVVELGRRSALEITATVMADA